jgi:two-component system sensor histidine kinase SenX3
VDLLIDVATIEGGVVQTPTDEVDVAAVAQSVVDRWSGVSPKHVFSTMIGRGAVVLGNEALLRHALHELVDNAIKFSPDGGLVTVGVRTDRRPREVTVIVSDQGIGVSGEAAETMFDDFTQGDGSETRVYGGLGLGLAFVRRVATLHGGHIDVVSEPEQGTSVSIKLPMAEPAAKRSGRARVPARA